MERKYHKNDVLYNTDQVNEQIGVGRGNLTYERLDIFIDRINKKTGFGVISYIDYENNKPVEKQYVPYTETKQDIDELLNSGSFRNINMHYIDLTQVYFYIHDDPRERHYMDIRYTEYNTGKAEMKSMRVPKECLEYLKSKIEDYRRGDPRINRPFDGYSRDPIPPRTRETRTERRRNGLRMPEPSITSLWIKDIKALAGSIKDYALEKVGLGSTEAEIQREDELIIPSNENKRL